MSGRGDASRSMRIDLARLPDDVAELIERLRPGTELTLTRDGQPIATITGVAAPAPRPAAGAVTAVVTAMKLSDAARAALSAELGPDYIVLDMHSAPPTVDVVLAPPGSPQLVGSLRSMFPKARVMVAEIEDAELGIEYRGQVRRLLDAGADTYLASTTVSHLAKTLDLAVSRRELAAGPVVQLEIGPADASE